MGGEQWPSCCFSLVLEPGTLQVVFSDWSEKQVLLLEQVKGSMEALR